MLSKIARYAKHAISPASRSALPLVCSRDGTLRPAGLSLGVYYGGVGEERESRDSRQDSLQDRPQDVLIDRLTVAEAARRLGVTQDAVRKRIARGTIRYDRGEDGVFVYLSAADTGAGATKTDQDTEQDNVSATDQDRYVRSLEDQIRFLRGELERKDAILLRLAERIPELESYSEPREPPETGTESGENAKQPSPAAGGAMADPIPQQRRHSRWGTLVLAALIVAAIALIVVGWLTGFFSFLY
jgi:hypothetical protein